MKEDTMDKQFNILGAGELLWDMLPSGRRCGGAIGNFIYHAALQGCNAKLVTAVGKDENGRELLSLLASKGLDTSLIAENGLHTSTVTVTLANGHPEYVIHQPVAWDEIPLTDAMQSFASQSDAFCFGSLAQRSPRSKETIHALAKQLPKEAISLFDVNIRQNYYTADILKASLDLTTILKVSDEEFPVLQTLLGLPGDIQEAIRSLIHQYRLSCVLLTLGEKGSVYCDASSWIPQAAEKVSVVDTVGCGDAFGASFLVAWLNGSNAPSALRHASYVAGLVAARAGAMPDDSEFLHLSRQSLAQAVQA